MSKPKRPARPQLEVTIMFEPTRLAATHLADAYTQVVPLRPRPAHLPATTPPWMVLQDRAVPSTSGGWS